MAGRVHTSRVVRWYMLHITVRADPRTATICPTITVTFLFFIPKPCNGLSRSIFFLNKKAAAKKKRHPQEAKVNLPPVGDCEHQKVMLVITPIAHHGCGRHLAPDSRHDTRAWRDAGTSRGTWGRGLTSSSQKTPGGALWTRLRGKTAPGMSGCKYPRDN